MNRDTQQLLLAYNDPKTVELMINDDGSAYIEKPGGILDRLSFSPSPEAVLEFVAAITDTPAPFALERLYADMTARDGSRVHLIVPPLTRRGLCVTIRKRPAQRQSLDQLVELEALTSSCAGFLRLAVQHHRNVLIVGGPSSGKTTILNALASLTDPRDRVLVLEDTPELTLPQPHVIYLQTRIRDPQGRPDVTLRDLLVNALRMRPDRIMVGEARGPEAADMLEAMNVGNEGVMATLHANSAREGLQRLETLVLLSGIDLPLKAVRANIVQGVDLVVFTTRLADGSRRVAQVCEVTGMELDTIVTADLFRFDPRKAGRGRHGLRPTGTLPRFYDLLRAQGFDLPLEFFKED